MFIQESVSWYRRNYGDMVKWQRNIRLLYSIAVSWKIIWKPQPENTTIAIKRESDIEMIAL